MDFRGQLEIPVTIDLDVNNKEELKIANESIYNIHVSGHKTYRI